MLLSEGYCVYVSALCRCILMACLSQPGRQHCYNCLLFLSPHSYFGAARAAVDYFSQMGYECPPQHNPADYFLDVISLDVSGFSSLGFRWTDPIMSMQISTPLLYCPPQSRTKESEITTKKRIQYLAEQHFDRQPLAPYSKDVGRG